MTCGATHRSHILDGELTMTLQIPSCDRATALLNEWAIQVATTEPRKTDELFLLARLFEKANGILPITFPLTIELSEKPDFVFTFGNLRIGVEVTQFLAEQLARAQHIASEQKSGMVITPFDFDSPKRNNDQIRERMKGNQVGLADWVEIPKRIDTHAKEMAAVIESKTHKILSNKEDVFSENWLIVEDRMYMSYLELGTIMPRIHRLLAQKGNVESFDLILFVLLEEVRGFQKKK